MDKNDRFIVRIDDIGQLPEQSKPDIGLKYYKSWYNAGNWHGVILHLGVVPSGLSLSDLEWLQEHAFTSGHEICIHGFDHRHGPLTAEQIRLAHERLPKARCVIPPYNEYDYSSIVATGRLADDAVIFGGRNGIDHTYGVKPTTIQCTLHLNAEESLYARTYQLPNALRALPACEYPRVVTLHHRWDHSDITRGRPVSSILRERSVSVNEAWKWIKSYQQ